MKAREQFGINNRYELIRQLGEGGMGVVYQAKDKELGRTVAIKIIRQGKGLDLSYIKRFSREARLLATLSHPNLLKIFEVELKAEPPYIVTEYLDGDDLWTLVAKERYPSHLESKRFVKELAYALAALHEKNIVHRDIKAANVFREKNGKFKLMDLGLARPLEETRLTDQGSVLGTLNYMPPEVLRGYDANPASDVYQFGLVVHEVMTGDRLQGVDEKGDFSPGMLDLDLWGAREPNEDLPVEFRQLVSTCCQKEVSKRPQNGAELLKLVEELFGGANAETTAIDTAACEVVQKEKQTKELKAEQPRKLFSFVMTLFLFALVLVVYSMLETGSVQSSGENSPLFVHMKEWLLLPNEIVLILPPGGKRPHWRLEHSRNVSFSGRFSICQKGWKAIVNKPPEVKQATLKVYRGEHFLGHEQVTFPATVFTSRPIARFGHKEVELFWGVRGRVELKGTLSLPERSIVLARSSSKKGKLRLLPKHMRKGERNVSWTLSYENKIHVSGKGALGFSERGRIDFRKPTKRDNRGYPLFPAIVHKGALYTFFDPSLLVCWQQVSTENGVKLQHKWCGVIPASDKNAVKYREFSFWGPCGEELIIASSNFRYRLNLERLRHHWNIVSRDFKSNETFDLHDYLKNVAPAIPSEELLLSQTALGRGKSLNLSDGSLLAAIPSEDNKINFELYSPTKKRIAQVFTVTGSQIYALEKHSDDLVLLSHLKDNETHLTLLRVSFQKNQSSMRVLNTIKLGPKPDLSRGFHFDGPLHTVITTLPNKKHSLIAYDSHVLLFTANREGGKCRKLEVDLPKGSFTRAALPLSENSFALLNLNPWSQSLNVQCHMTIYKLVLKDDGNQELKPLTTKFVSERAIVSRVGLTFDELKRLYYYAEDDTFVATIDKSRPHFEYEGHIRAYNFRFGLFRFGDSIYTLTRGSSVIGTDIVPITKPAKGSN